MNIEGHLDSGKIDQAAAGKTTSESDLHLADCDLCRARVARAVKIERALCAMSRVEPAPGLASRITASLNARQAQLQAVEPRQPKPYAFAVGIAAALGTLVALALVYEVGLELAASGALNFLSLFLRRPEVVMNYPGDALATMVEVLPVPQMLMTLGIVIVVIVLARSFGAAFDVAPARGSSRHA